MTYAIRQSSTGSQMLVEMTPRTARLAVDGKHDQARHGVTFRICDAAYAHRWVKNDGLHSTALWVDNGRVRRA
jgi:hypothetical protein